MNELSSPARVGIVGTGPMAQSFAKLIQRHCPDLSLGAVLTRRDPDSVSGFDPACLTVSLSALLDNSDIVVEMSGDVFHGSLVAEAALKAGLPVATLNAELHVTTGSYLAGLGVFSEAEGDQPGSIAALHEDALAMGFTPMVYGNMKGFLDHNPSRASMAYWAERQGISLANTTGATDGTKVQIEQVLVANGLGAGILLQGLAGPACASLAEGAAALARQAQEKGMVIADYVLAEGWAPTGVFIVARHDADLAPLLNYFKLGAGPDYLLVKPYHLCSLEVAKTVRRLLAGGKVLLNNGSRPRMGVGAVAKHVLLPGDFIGQGSGGFDVRGEAVMVGEYLQHVPIGLMSGARMRRRVEPGQMLGLDDVDLPDSRVAAIALQCLCGSVA
ncbi:NAD(P)-dependent oxidoreductase [Aquitalea sp. S1-19]|nr:NAD(P)-dependent oxidoreductase [Aquitalea sp. S1-19]